jgi:Zn finger protein HypA/HybF involved in hydrogenase expression
VTSDDVLDGNTLAGKLAELLSFEVTNSAATCANCGQHAPMATWTVYVNCPGFVGRCSSCDHVQVRVVEDGRGRSWLDLSGVACLEIIA